MFFSNLLYPPVSKKLGHNGPPRFAGHSVPFEISWAIR